MKELAQSICNDLDDYHNCNGFQFKKERVIEWVSQFEEEDREFILSELLHLLNKGIYISENKARKLLIKRIVELSKYYNFKKPIDFLNNTKFIKMQSEEKSQSILLGILNEELNSQYGISINKCGSVSAKYLIYVDDILASGKTVFEDCKKLLEMTNEQGETNFDSVIKKEKIIIVSLFCLHSWGCSNVDWRLKMAFKEDDRILRKIVFAYDFEVQNHPTKPDQKFNFAYPNSKQPQTVLDYLSNLTARNKREFAFRKDNKPLKEEFFSSPENRVRFENVILNKGIEILGKAKKLSSNHRPLGVVTPSYQTLGAGTLFFTWRNISNTTPIVFWWGAHWFPLFPLINRGT